VIIAQGLMFDKMSLIFTTSCPVELTLGGYLAWALAETSDGLLCKVAVRLKNGNMTIMKLPIFTLPVIFYIFARNSIWLLCVQVTDHGMGVNGIGYYYAGNCVVYL
jgi:hypothetical protein